MNLIPNQLISLSPPPLCYSAPEISILRAKIGGIEPPPPLLLDNLKQGTQGYGEDPSTRLVADGGA